jgi:hypothetical protein
MLIVKQLINGTPFEIWLCNKEVTMAHRKQPERRTFLQDRFEILIKRQKSGTATFNELTELDGIVNSDPELREKVIRESMLMEEGQGFEGPASDPENQTDSLAPGVKKIGFFTWLRLKVFRIFNFKTPAAKIRNPLAGSTLLAL